MNFTNDIYFDHNYGKLYEKNEYGKTEIFRYEDSIGVIESQFIKRIIPNSIDNNTYYDICTPYGYGGPRIVSCKPERKEELVKLYEKSFEKYCMENGIVHEFVRFHPVLNNALDFKDMYSLEFRRKTLGTNLKISDDPIKSELSKNCRNIIKNIFNKGVTYEIIVGPHTLYDFIIPYYETMRRNNAAEDYYFSEEYFENLVKYFKDQIIYIKTFWNGKLIGATVNFFCNGLIQSHLSGIYSEYLNLAPSYVMFYALVLWGIENNCSLVHYGGGRTPAPDDGLYLFKRKFAQNTEFDYYVSDKIWNEEVYKKLYYSLGGNDTFSNLVKKSIREMNVPMTAKNMSTNNNV